MDDPTVRRFVAATNAVVDGDLTELRRLLAEDPGIALRSSPLPHHCTLLHCVAHIGVDDPPRHVSPSAPAIARELIEHGADPNSTVAFGGGPRSTPLVSLVTSEHAVLYHRELVDAFVDGGAKVDGVADECAPLDLAIGHGCGAAARALADRGARVATLVHAAGLGRLDLARQHLDREPDRRAVDQAFIAACRFGHLNVAELLLDGGAELAARGSQGFTALHTAAWYGTDSVLEWLLERGAPLERRNVCGGTVLDGTCWAAVNAPAAGVHYAAIVDRLCQAGADLAAVDPYPTGDAAVDAVLGRHGR